MKWSNRASLSLLIALAGLFCGCGGSKVNTPEDGQVKNNVYTNKFFKFRVQIPQTWTVLKKPTVREMRQGTEALMGGDKAAAAAALQSMARIRTLLLARNVVAGMSISVTAEDLSKTPDIRTAEEYINHALELMTGPGKPMQPVNEITAVEFAGREFHRADITGSVMNIRLHQSMFVSVEKGYALVFVLSAKSENSVEEALAMTGLTSATEQIASTPKSSKPAQTVAAREPQKNRSTVAGRTATKTAAPDPEWIHSIRLQGIGGTSTRRLAIINGRTLGPGDGIQVKAGTKTIILRCVSVRDNSATVNIEGIEGERELFLQ